MGNETSLPPSPSAHLQKTLVRQVQVILFTRRPVPPTNPPNGHNRGREPEGLVCCPRSDLFPTVNSRNIPDRECISPPFPSLWFSLICGCGMTICLYLHFEAVTWLSAFKGFCKEPHRCARWDKASQCKGASP